MKKHFVSIQFDVPNIGWRTWIGFVPDTNGKCIIYPNQLFKSKFGYDMPPYTRILL